MRPRLPSPVTLFPTIFSPHATYPPIIDYTFLNAAASRAHWTSGQWAAAAPFLARIKGAWRKFFSRHLIYRLGPLTFSSFGTPDARITSSKKLATNCYSVALPEKTRPLVAKMKSAIARCFRCRAMSSHMAFSTTSCDHAVPARIWMSEI